MSKIVPEEPGIDDSRWIQAVKTESHSKFFKMHCTHTCRNMFLYRKISTRSRNGAFLPAFLSVAGNLGRYRMFSFKIIWLEMCHRLSAIIAGEVYLPAPPED
jgi:hypothetical protein